MLFKETVAVYCENHTEHRNLVRTPLETHYTCATETNRLMSLGETIAVLEQVVHLLTTGIFKFKGISLRAFVRSWYFTVRGIF
jgi:hypothetical protein